MKNKICVGFTGSVAQKRQFENNLAPIQDEIDVVWIEKSTIETPYVICECGTFRERDLNILVNICSNGNAVGGRDL